MSNERKPNFIVHQGAEIAVRGRKGEPPVLVLTVQRINRIPTLIDMKTPQGKIVSVAAEELVRGGPFRDDRGRIEPIGPLLPMYTEKEE